MHGTWTAICADTKLTPCWHVGARDAPAAYLLMEDLASRPATRVQLTPDGHRPYLVAVEGAFGWNGVDYVMLVNLYGEALEGQKRYGLAKLISAENTWVMGDPDEDHVATSYVERQNLTVRMNIPRSRD